MRAGRQLRRKNVSTLVKRRAEIIEHGGAEKKHGAAGGGVDSTMLEMERQHKAKILEATKRRMYEEQQRNLAEEAKKEQMIEDERKMDAVLEEGVMVLTVLPAAAADAWPAAVSLPCIQGGSRWPGHGAAGDCPLRLACFGAIEQGG